MADAKISALTNNTTPAYGDMIPLVNVDGADETQRTSLGLLQNWVTVDDAWAYASATTITVPSGAVSRYSIGDKVTLVQTTVKFFYIVGIADTVLTVTGGSDYTVANAAISAIAFSKSVSPVGFPHYFALTGPTWTSSGAAFTNQPTNHDMYFNLVGNMATIKGLAQCHATSGATGVLFADFVAGQLPVCVTSSIGIAYNLTTYKSGGIYISSSLPNQLAMTLYDSSTMATNSEYFWYSISYRI